MSAMTALLVAIDAAITADEALRGLGVVWYVGKAPPDALTPYICGDDLNEPNSNRLGRKGARPGITFHIWDVDHMKVANLYSELHRLLHLQPLAISGQVLDRGDLVLLSVIIDPGGYSHGIAEYRARTKVA